MRRRAMFWKLACCVLALAGASGCGGRLDSGDDSGSEDGPVDVDGDAPPDAQDVPDDAHHADGADDEASDATSEVDDDAAALDDAVPDDDGGGGGVVVGLTDRSFTYDGVETFVLAASYYGGCGAGEDVIRSDLGQLAGLGFNNVRVWTTWTAPTDAVAVLQADGSLDPVALARLRFLLETARGLGMSVDVTSGFGTAGVSDGGFDSYRDALAALATELLPYRNAWFDLGNERDVGDARFLSVEQVRDLAVAVRAVDAARLVTASGGGSDGAGAGASWTELYAVADLDFAAPHFSRDADWAAQTESRVATMRDLLLAAGWVRPIYLQEEARRGYSGAEWPKEMFLEAVAGARRAGAAGWCFHTDAGFDLVAGSFFDQLDDVERDLIDELAAAAAP